MRCARSGSTTSTCRRRRSACGARSGIGVRHRIPARAAEGNRCLTPNSLSREAINELPIRRYAGEVRLVATHADAERAAADFAAERVVGFDTETRPSFRAGERHPPALAQVATARAVYLFRLQRMDFSATLGPLLSSARTVKAGVGLADDLRQLATAFA